jgi:Na+-transporting NADH:ubiquinone oxidoreductase subunit C
MLHKDSIANTLLVSVGLCVVCALLVSSAAVGLKSYQSENKVLDLKRNVIAAAGLAGEGGAGALSSTEVKQLFDQRIEKRLVDIATGDYVADADQSYDPRKAAKDPGQQKAIQGSFPIGLGNREPQTWVYLVKAESGEIEKVVSVSKDMRTISGLTFYEHAETPGLGGEVENPSWKAKWVGKQIWASGVESTDENLKVGVAKGAPASGNEPYEVDGLAGATITSRGVSMLVKYWFSKEGFGPYLQKLASQQGAADGKTNS